MITLYQFAPAWGLLNPSPFCMKVEVYLRMVRLPYQTQIANPRRFPKLKLPVIQDGKEVIADSNFILDHLKRNYGDPLDADLAPEERATALAFQRLCEEFLYFVGIYLRWVPDPAWGETERTFFGFLSGWKRKIIPPLVRREMRKNLFAQGLGRHSPDEVVYLAKKDVQSLSDFLGEKPYMMGGKPTSLDATVYSFLANLLIPPYENHLVAFAKTRSNLSRYCDRMKERFEVRREVP